MSEDRARARSDGDAERAGWDWETKAVMDAIRAPSDMSTKNGDRAASAVKNDGDGAASRGAWLQVGDVEDELSTLVSQKMSGEIGEADFRAGLFRLLDIKHARSVADIQEETLQRRSAFRRHSSWAAGTTDVAKASRRARARAARASARAALEATRRSNEENSEESGKNNKSDPGTRRSRSSSRKERRGRSCNIGGIAGAGSGAVGGGGARVAVPRASTGSRRGHRSGLPSGREGLPPPGRQTPPGRRRTISIGIVAGAMTGEGKKGYSEILRTPERFPVGKSNGSSSRSGDVTDDITKTSYVMIDTSFLQQNTGIEGNSISSRSRSSSDISSCSSSINGSGIPISSNSNSSSSIKSDVMVIRGGKEEGENNRGFPGGVPRGRRDRHPRPAAMDSRRDARSVSPAASNSSSSSYSSFSSCSSTGIVGAKQRRKRQQQLQQHKQKQHTVTTTVGATATATAADVDVSGTKQEKQQLRAGSSSSSGGDDSGGIGTGSSTKGEKNAEVAGAEHTTESSSPSIDWNACLLRKPRGMTNDHQHQHDFSKNGVSHSHGDVSQSHGDLSHSNDDVSHSHDDARDNTGDVSHRNDDASRSEIAVSHSHGDVSHSNDDVNHSQDDISHGNDDRFRKKEDVCATSDDVRNRGCLKEALEGASRKKGAFDGKMWEADPLPKAETVHCTCTVS